MAVPRLLGDRYRLEELLGEGGMSVVWRAHDPVLRRSVAVKILANPAVTRPALRRSIRTDAQSAAGLSHPNIAGVYDYGEYIDRDGRSVPYVVMELLPGRVLADRLTEGPLDPPLALRVCAQVAGALAAAHAQDVVHRDVKPGNVMLTPGGAKVFDFGIAASVGELDDADPNSPLLGTAAYLAPERIAGAPVTAASDVYALALLLFRTLTNSLPWSAQTVTEMIEAHVYVEPQPLPAVKGVSASVRELAQRCLAKEPEQRPSARDAAILLAAAAGIAPALGDDSHAATPVAVGPVPGVTPESVAAPAAPTSTAPGRRGRLRPLIVAAAVVALFFATIVIRLSAETGPPSRPTQAQAAGPLTPSPSAATTAPQTAHTGGATPPRGPTSTAHPPGGSSAPAAPDNPPTSPAPSSGGPGDTPTPATFTSSGGSVVAGCQGTDASLTSWTPAPGYSAQQVQQGPAPTASVVFHQTSTRVTMTITCPAGRPTSTVTTR